MTPPATPCRGPRGVTRRTMIQVGGIGLLNLGLPSLLAADDRRGREKTAPAARADACILVFLNGGPSHLDTWDMKPDLPQEMRSEFRPVPTTLTGVQVCEHLPRLAQLLHRCTLVRSVHHDQVAHAPAVYTALTGVRSNVRSGIMGASVHDHPAIGSVVGGLRPPVGDALPYVLLPYLTAEGAGGPPQPGFLAGWMGKRHDPVLVLPGDPPDGLRAPGVTPRPELTADRLLGRRNLLSVMDPASAAGPQPSRQFLALRERAFDLLDSAAVRRAFLIEREPARLRERYGRNIYGQSLLLARRLIESGTRLVCVSWAPDANATWDTHGQNFVKLRNVLLPQFDLAFTALVEDLSDRGLLDRTLVVAMGEIGRTPRINGNAGRDHWEHCYSVLFAGGGMREGHVHGSSDRYGALPRTDPVHAADVIATIYYALGIPADTELHDNLGRPIPAVPGGRPVTSLFA